MNRVEEAVEKFRSGFNCSQAVVGSYGELFGLDGQAAHLFDHFGPPDGCVLLATCNQAAAGCVALKKN